MKTTAYWTKYGRFCKACGSKKNLHVHHVTYERFGNELLTDLLGLCYTCHKGVHELHRKTGRRDLRRATYTYVNKIRNGKTQTPKTKKI
jgi:5-methylcytosine-specific restriction endonuclease McrA